jgi:membrane protein implicated in regulation of membrane protease activity
LVVGSSMVGIAAVPFWVQSVVFLWLAAMFLYYLLRFFTATRSGSGDEETRRRGAALDGALAPLHDEIGKPPCPASPG